MQQSEKGHTPNATIVLMRFRSIPALTSDTAPESGPQAGATARWIPLLSSACGGASTCWEEFVSGTSSALAERIEDSRERIESTILIAKNDHRLREEDASQTGSLYKSSGKQVGSRSGRQVGRKRRREGYRRGQDGGGWRVIKDCDDRATCSRFTGRRQS